MREPANRGSRAAADPIPAIAAVAAGLSAGRDGIIHPERSIHIRDGGHVCGCDGRVIGGRDRGVAYWAAAGSGFAGGIERGAATVKCEACATKNGTFEGDLAGGDFEAQPLASRRESPHIAPAS